MNKKLLAVAVALVVILVIFVLLVWLVGDVLGVERFKTGENPILRFVFVIVGLLVALAIYLATSQNKAWEVGTRQVVWMAIGAALYAVFSWLFNGSVFFIPSVSRNVSVSPPSWPCARASW